MATSSKSQVSPNISPLSLSVDILKVATGILGAVVVGAGTLAQAVKEQEELLSGESR